MFNNDTMKATGKVHVVVHDKNGLLKDERIIDNLVVDTGLDWIAARMYDTAIPVQMSHMAVGTGATAAAAGDTTVETENARVALSSTTVTDNAVAYAATFAAGTGTAALTEAGILNASSAGTLLARTVFSVINKGASDTMAITWTITIS
jgi:hypothetical protein